MAEKIYPEQLLRLQEEQEKALRDTNDQFNQWQKFKSDYEALKKRLLTLPDQVTHDVMVPFGKMAFMPGQLVHTNEILVLLGDNWFAERSAKQAAEIVDRRMEAVDKQLKELTRQRQLLEPRHQFTSELQQMSQEGGEMMEIREEYDEERERQWKETHRKHVREYRRRLKKEAEKQKTSQPPEQTGQNRLTDEELWARLDQLERIESERKEVQKLGTDSEKKLKGYKFPDFPSSTEKIENVKEIAVESDNSETDNEESSYTASDELDSDDDDDDVEGADESIEEELDSKGTLITFSHSLDIGNIGQVASETNKDQLPMTSPGDIYTNYVQSMKPKSILKKSPGEQKKKVKHKTKRREVAFDTGSEEDIVKNKPLQKKSLEPAFSGTVVEKSIAENSVTRMSPLQEQAAPQRPVSKFKAQSANQNRVIKKEESDLTNQTDC